MLGRVRDMILRMYVHTGICRYVLGTERRTWHIPLFTGINLTISNAGLDDTVEYESTAKFIKVHHGINHNHKIE